MSEMTIGTCSLCGGRVTVPAPWLGVIPPTPTCQRCGAEAASFGPTIPMRQPSDQPADVRRVIITKDNTA